jgi:hypothetical protein
VSSEISKRDFDSSRRREAVNSSLLLLALFLLACVPAYSQGPGQTITGLPVEVEAPAPAPPEGKRTGEYRVTQSIEVGGRITETAGSTAMYDTLVNLQSGPRILDQSLSMHSLTHTGLFDSLSESTFGWGGDPNNAARLRIVKYRLYNFDASFRRDQNYFDYNLFANPLNSPTATPAVPVGFSPHAYFSGRHMYDFELTVFPQRRFSLDLDYSRNRITGPSFSSVHDGTDALLFQPLNNTLDAYRIGLNWRIGQHTTANFTEIVQANKGDTSYSLAPFNQVALPNGTPVEFGLPWFNGFSPCGKPIVGGAANPVCNGYFNYLRTQRVRTTTPTEQFNLQSSAIKKVDFVGRFAYSSADMSSPVDELFNGLITRTGERVIDLAGSHASGRWISVVSDAGVTVHLSDRLRLVDTFRFRNFRVPGVFDLVSMSLFNASSVTPPGSLLFPPVSPTASPLHTDGTPADLLNDTYSRRIGQNSQSNEFEVQFDFARYAGIRIGYRFQHTLDQHSWSSVANGNIYYPPLANRGDCADLPLNPNGTCTFTGEFDSEVESVDINTHTGLVGLWFRPIQNLRVNFEAEAGYADSFFTRIDPRHVQRYRADANYTPRPWLTLGTNLNMFESRNHTGDINYGMHNRNFGLNAMVAPNPRFSLDLAYNFTGFLQDNQVCYIATITAPGSFPCVNDDTNSLLEALGHYRNHTHFGSFSVMFKPVARVAARLGYSVTNVDGNTLILDPLQPLGPLASKLQQPLAALDINLSKNLTWHGGWNYYQYNEGSFVGPTTPRYFHANVTTLSLIYAF